jgi:lysophospholipase L1-like esterase
MEWYEEEVAAIEAERTTKPPATGAVVFYGSSSIRLWDTLEEDFPGIPVVNAGFGGSTLTACAWFFDRLVVPLRPRSLVVYAGDNDLGDGKHSRDVVASYHALIGQVDQRLGPIPFGFVSIKPSPARHQLLEQIRQTNQHIQLALEQRPNSYFINVFDAMLDNGVPRADLFAEDGLHLNAAGYQLWREILQGQRQLLDSTLSAF